MHVGRGASSYLPHLPAIEMKHSIFQDTLIFMQQLMPHIARNKSQHMMITRVVDTRS
jgi:hypothetical protein